MKEEHPDVKTLRPMLPRGHFNGGISELIPIHIRAANASTFQTKKPIYGQMVSFKIVIRRMKKEQKPITTF